MIVFGKFSYKILNDTVSQVFISEDCLRHNNLIKKLTT